MIKYSSAKFQSSTRHPFRLPKRISLLALIFVFSLCSVGLMEDFQQNIWLKNYLLIAALLWGNLLIYLSFYPQWGQRLISLEKPNSDQK